MEVANPKIGVIMSVYNDDKFLEESITSILEQSYSNFIFYICDDNSSDSSYDIVQHYKRLDERIKLARNRTNRGLAYSLNKLIRMADTEIIARMDADDISYKNRFQEQVNFLYSTNKDIIWSNAILIDEDGDIICNRYQPSINESLDKMPYRNFVVHPSIMCKKTLYFDHGFYDESIKYGQDYDLWLRWYRTGVVKFGLLNQVLLEYRIKQGSNTDLKFNLSKNKDEKYAKLCLANKDYRRFKKYYKNISKLSINKYQLLLRYLIGESTIDKFKRFIANET